MTTPQTRVWLSSASASGEPAMTASDLLSEMQFPHTRGTGYHQITAVHNGMEVGWLRWNDGSPSAQHAHGGITALGVAKDYQGHGVATRMYRKAGQISPVVHSQARTRAGEGWAGSVGGPMRPLREEGYLADIAPPPVSPVGRVVREALEAGNGAASGRNAAGSGIRYLVLPIEAVARMQSGDFGVSMSEILPNGYITPGSFTNDRRYRVSELAEDIRRNGVERPLWIYMGRTRPIVHDGQHRYAAAIMADATHLTLEITYPEDVRDVIEWACSAPGPSRYAHRLAIAEFPAPVALESSIQASRGEPAASRRRAASTVSHTQHARPGSLR
jgi:GNAT superfamily N-acetyltransferase